MMMRGPIVCRYRPSVVDVVILVGGIDKDWDRCLKNSLQLELISHKET